jgi:hypothetical protein
VNRAIVTLRLTTPNKHENPSSIPPTRIITKSPVNDNVSNKNDTSPTIQEEENKKNGTIFTLGSLLSISLLLIGILVVTMYRMRFVLFIDL